MLKTTNGILTVQAFSQSVPARVGAWWGRRRGQGDCDWGLDWVIHGQDQAGAPDRYFVFCQCEFVIHTFIRWAAPGAGRTLVVDGVGSGGVRADSDVGIHGAHAGIVQDEVRVVVAELTFVLIGLWAGEASCQRPTTSRQSSSEGRAAVGQEGLQVVVVKVIPDPEGPGALMFGVPPL